MRKGPKVTCIQDHRHYNCLFHGKCTLIGQLLGQGELGRMKFDMCHMYAQLGSSRRRSGCSAAMYEKIVLEFSESVARGCLPASYFNAGGADYMTKQKQGWSYHESLKEYGILQVYPEGGMPHENFYIRYSGRGHNKDVYSVSLTKDGSVFPAVMKVMASNYHETLGQDVKQALDLRVAGMMPEQYGMYKDVPVITIEAGQSQRRHQSHTVCVQIEAACGQDVAVKFDELLRYKGHDGIDEALELWSGAVRFWVKWQLREGGGKRGEHNFLTDMHARNICGPALVLLFVSLLVSWSSLFV